MSAHTYYQQLEKYLRFISGLKKFHKQRLNPQEAIDQARTFIRKRVDAREKNFQRAVAVGSGLEKFRSSARECFNAVEDLVRRLVEQHQRRADGHQDHPYP